MGTIRFELRTDKPGKDGYCPVDLIYSASNQRKKHSTGIKLLSEYWDKKEQLVLYHDRRTAKKLFPNTNYDLLLSNSEVNEINSKLAAFTKSIADIEKRFELDKVPYSSIMVIDLLKTVKHPETKKEQPSKILFDFIDQYIETHKSTRVASSLCVYKSLKNHLKAYQDQTKKKVTFENIDYLFFQSFQNFLIDSRGLNNTTVAKQLSTVKTFLNYARTHGIDVSNKYKDFKIKRENLEVIALTSDEFEKLYNLDLQNNKRLARVRDIFCLACTTGLRYSDLAQLKKEHIKDDEIKIIVKKTKEPLTIPLNSYSKAILKKYEQMKDPLPIISNQKMNQYIKGWDEKDKSGNVIKHHEGLCELADINESVEIVRFRGAKREAITYKKYQLIGVHTGRKTFATLSLEKGMSAEEVMTITGHKDYKSFKRYVKITEQRKKVVMVKAWGNITNDVKLKAV